MFKQATATIALATLVAGANYKHVTCPDGVNTATNEACCTFFALRDDLQNNLFDSECGEDVHESLRFTFHDAVGISRSGALKGGGADGSIIIFNDTELLDPGNAGIDDSVAALAPFLTRHDVTAGDLIQFAGALGTSNCPGAPRLEFLAGLPNATFLAQNDTVPLPQSPVDQLLERMNDAGFDDKVTVHLLASYSIADSDTLVPGHQAVPFDTTPFIFVPQIFFEVLLQGVGVPFGVNNSDGAEVDSPLPQSGEMRLQSDFAISHDERTACEWQAQISDQELMMKNFAAAMSILAVTRHNREDLIDCSELIPTPPAPVGSAATFPAGTSPDEVQQVCKSPFPSLSVTGGQATQIPECPDGDLNLADCPS